MKKFEEEFNYLIELSGKVLTGQIEAEKFEKHRTIFLNKYAEKQQPEIPEFVAKFIKYTADPIYEISAWAEHYGDNGSKCDDPDLAKTLDWFGMNRNLFYKAVINGYTVAKPKTIVSPCPVCGFEDVENNFCGVCGHKNEYVTAD
ncbi:DUF1642 domain-containing protein [Lactococcus petauri]|uniref:DUF1642 domain-containing protein n=1 Tax=Lactococcus petauri TaxID=1940789 RepID=UPI00254F5345|nr:DUF1642 domain-containing protein [Lactococcus petauri]